MSDDENPKPTRAARANARGGKNAVDTVVEADYKGGQEFFLGQFDKHYELQLTEAEIKDTIKKVKNCKELVDFIDIKAKETTDGNEIDVISESERKANVKEIQALPNVVPLMKAKKQFKRIVKTGSKKIEEIIDFIRMQQYVERFSVDGTTELSGDDDEEDVKKKEEEDEAEHHHHHEDEAGGSPKFITRKSILFDKLQQGLQKFKNDSEVEFLRDFKLQLSDIVEWKQKLYIIQKGIHLQEEKGDPNDDYYDEDDVEYAIKPYLTIYPISSSLGSNMQPNKDKAKEICLETTVGDSKEDWELLINPESNLWVQYNQYIFYFVIENDWANKKTKITLVRYNLEDGTTKNQKEYEELGEDECKAAGGSPSGTFFGVKTIAFSKNLSVPILNKDGELDQLLVDLNQDNKDTEEAIEDFLNKHLIILQSEIKNEADDQIHCGRISQIASIKPFKDTEGFVVYPKQLDASFNLTVWTAKDLKEQKKTYSNLSPKAVGVVYVTQHQNGASTEIELNEIFETRIDKSGTKCLQFKAKETIKNQDLLLKQACQQYDGQYQKLYRKNIIGDKAIFNYEMISNTDDMFKFKVVNKLGLLGDRGIMNEDWFPNPTDNINMIFHEHNNLYQFYVVGDGTMWDEEDSLYDRYKILISNPKESNNLPHTPFIWEDATLHVRLFTLFSQGYKQFNPQYMNVVIDTDKQIQYVPNKGKIVNILKINETDMQTHDLDHRYQEKHAHEQEKGAISKDDHPLELQLQKRFEPCMEDRKVWLGLRYAGNKYQYVNISVRLMYKEIKGDKEENKNKELFKQIGYFNFNGNTSQCYRTSLVPSSGVQRICGHDLIFKQTYSLGIMSVSMLYMDIFEYLLEWTEKNPSADNCSLKYIGRKLLVLNQPYNRKEIARCSQNVLFVPHYKNGDDFFIDGTHLFSNNPTESQFNLYIPTLKEKDFQFRGDICSSGFKRFVEKADGEDEKVVALLIVTKLSDALMVSDNMKFLPSQRNLLFEQQIRTLLNIWPKKDLYQSIQKYYTPEDIDPLASLEIIGGNSLGDFLITQPNALQYHLSKDQKAVKARSLIQHFGQDYMTDGVKNYFEDLCKAFPHQLRWVREPFSLTDDLVVSNPLVKCFKVKNIDSTIVCIKLLIKNVFESGKSVVSYNRLVQILPEIINPKRKQYGFDEYMQFFQDYGEDGSEENLTFAIKLKHDDLPKFSDKRIFMRSFESLDYPNTDMREKAMEEIKKQDIKPPKKESKWKQLTQLFVPNDEDEEDQKPIKSADDGAEEIGEQEQQDSEDDDNEGAVKNIPVDHFMINLNFMGLDKIIQNFIDTGKIGDDVEKKKETFMGSKRDDITVTSELGFVKIMHAINTKYGDSIVEQQTLQDLIDYIFNERSEGFFYVQQICYICFFVWPYGAQLLFYMLPWWMIIGLTGIAEITSLSFFYLESISFRIEGFKHYREDPNNFFDFFSFCCFNAYFVLRLFYQGVQYVGMDHQLEVTPLLVINIFLNCFITMNIVIKILWFMQVNEKFGQLVQLVKTCIYDIKEFTFFMFMWIFFFSIISKVLGSDNTMGAYPNINIYFQILIQTWEDSMGSISAPSTNYWIKHSTSEHKGVRIASQASMYAIYFFWFINQFLILIILINFLIAVISQSYENVMDSRVIYKYSQRAELNLNMSNVYEFQGKLLPRFDCIILSSNTDHGGGGDWQGFCSAVKSFVKDGNSKVFENIGKVNTQINASKQEIFEQLKQNKCANQKKIQEIQNYLDDLKDKMPKQNDDSLNQSAMLNQSQVWGR